MYSQVKKPQGDHFSIAGQENRAAANHVVQKKNNVKQGFVFEDNRLGLAIQRQQKMFTEQNSPSKVNEKVQMPEVMQRAMVNYPGNVIQRSIADNIEKLLLIPAPNHVERLGKFKVAARLEWINNQLEGVVEQRERLEAYKRILIHGNSFDARVRAHELAKKLPTEELNRVTANIPYKQSEERGKKVVKFAKTHSDNALGDKRDNINNKRAQDLIAKMTNATVTFNFNYGTTGNWTMPRMLNSFEVLKHNDKMSGNLKDNVDTRDEIEHEQFGIPSGMNAHIAKIADDKEKAKALNQKVPPELRPKYAALNFAGYHQGAAPSKYYGSSHMQFKNKIKARCTITGGDSLGAAGGMAGLAFPLTEDGIKGLVEYCSRIEKKDSVKWNSLDTQGQKQIYRKDETENPNNPDWNFIEVQIHGDVVYELDIAKIVIARSELNGVSVKQAIKNMERITGVKNIVVE